MLKGNAHLGLRTLERDFPASWLAMWGDLYGGFCHPGKIESPILTKHMETSSQIQDKELNGICHPQTNSSTLKIDENCQCFRTYNRLPTCNSWHGSISGERTLQHSDSIFIHLHPSSSIFIHLPVSGYILYINLRWHTVTIFQWPAPKVSLPLFGVGSLYKKRPIPSSRPGRSWDGPTSDHCWYPFPEFQAAERLALYFAEGAAYDKSKCSKESLQHIPLFFFMFNPHFLWLTQFPCTSILLQKNPWKKRYITQQARRSPRATELWVPSWNKRKCSRKGM